MSGRILVKNGVLTARLEDGNKSDENLPGDQPGLHRGLRPKHLQRNLPSRLEDRDKSDRSLPRDQPGLHRGPRPTHIQSNLPKPSMGDRSPSPIKVSQAGHRVATNNKSTPPRNDGVLSRLAQSEIMRQQSRSPRNVSQAGHRVATNNKSTLPRNVSRLAPTEIMRYQSLSPRNVSKAGHRVATNDKSTLPRNDGVLSRLAPPEIRRQQSPSPRKAGHSVATKNKSTPSRNDGVLSRLAPPKETDLDEIEIRFQKLLSGFSDQQRSLSLYKERMQKLRARRNAEKLQKTTVQSAAANKTATTAHHSPPKDQITQGSVRIEVQNSNPVNAYKPEIHNFYPLKKFKAKNPQKLSNPRVSETKPSRTKPDIDQSNSQPANLHRPKSPQELINPRVTDTIPTPRKSNTEESNGFSSSYFLTKIQALEDVVNSFYTPESPGEQNKGGIGDAPRVPEKDHDPNKNKVKSSQSLDQIESVPSPSPEPLLRNNRTSMSQATRTTCLRINLAGEIVTTHTYDNNGAVMSRRFLARQGDTVSIHEIDLVNTPSNDDRKSRDMVQALNETMSTWSSSREIEIGGPPSDEINSETPGNCPPKTSMCCRRFYMTSGILMTIIIIFGLGMVLGYTSYLITST